MRFDLRRSALTFLGSAMLLSCTDSPSSPRATPGAARHALLVAAPSVRFSEIHYDNTGTDAGEAIEISGPAGTDVTGWKIILYNGTGGASYDTKTLSGTIPATCGTRGVIVTNYAVNGIQNGSPDGMALVDAAGTVIEFLSYEGTFAAADGPATGHDVSRHRRQRGGNRGAGHVAAARRLRRVEWTEPRAPSARATMRTLSSPAPLATITVAPPDGDDRDRCDAAIHCDRRRRREPSCRGIAFTWTSNAPAIATVDPATGLATAKSAGDATITATSGAIVGTAYPARERRGAAPIRTVHFSEIHYDNAGTDAGEAIEVSRTRGRRPDRLEHRALRRQRRHGATTRRPSAAPSPPRAARAESSSSITRRTASRMEAPTASRSSTRAGTSSNSSRTKELHRDERPADGLLRSTSASPRAAPAPIGHFAAARQRNWYLVAPALLDIRRVQRARPPPPSNRICSADVSPTDPPLPIGFQDQLFATERDASNTIITTTFTWTSETPALATHRCERRHARARRRHRDVPRDRRRRHHRDVLAAHGVATASTTAAYGGNTEFGDPTDADPSDDFIVRHPQYTTSYNKNRGTPNWVSYDLDASQFGVERRSLRLLHLRSRAASELHALHDRRLHGRRRVRRLRHRSRTPRRARSTARPARSTTPTHTTSRTSSRRPPTSIRVPGPSSRTSSATCAQPEQRGLHHRGRRREQGDGEGRRQDRHPREHLESRRDHAARSGTRQRPRLSRPRGHRRHHAERSRRAKRRLAHVPDDRRRQSKR